MWKKNTTSLDGGRFHAPGAMPPPPPPRKSTSTYWRGGWMGSRALTTLSHAMISLSTWYTCISSRNSMLLERGMLTGKRTWWSWDKEPAFRAGGLTFEPNLVLFPLTNTNFENMWNVTVVGPLYPQSSASLPRYRGRSHTKCGPSFYAPGGPWHRRVTSLRIIYRTG
jgi:hypothetical protein